MSLAMADQTTRKAFRKLTNLTCWHQQSVFLSAFACPSSAAGKGQIRSNLVEFLIIVQPHHDVRIIINQPFPKLLQR